MTRFSNILALLTLLLVTTASAFDIIFPGPSNYWVACGWNNMTWKSTSTDPSTVTIMLTNSNKTLLNDDFEIGNALQGTENAAMIYVPCLPAATGYSLLFVNASSYDHKQDKVLYTSSEFLIKPKSTSPDPASGQESIPNKFQPFFQTPGIVIPQKGLPDDVINTTTTTNNAERELPKLDGSAASFKDFHPPQQDPNAAAMNALADLLFVMVIAAFTALVVTS